MEDVLENRYQRVVLNGQVSRWVPLNAGVSQGLILGSFLFLICISDLSTGLSSNPTLNNDLLKIINWAY